MDKREIWGRGDRRGWTQPCEGKMAFVKLIIQQGKL